MKVGLSTRNPVPSGSRERMRALLAQVGHPEEAFPVVHVTGSHGKSSVIAFLEAAFVASGYKTGVLSPTSLPGERVRLSGDPVPAGTLAPHLSRVEEAGEAGVRPIEKLAAAAFLLFAAEEVDIALVGAEIGGRHDLATCPPRRLLTLVTGVEEDRVDVFGRGVTRVSWEEAHTAAPGVPFLTVERKVEALAAFAEAAKRAGGALVILDPDEVRGRDLSWDGIRWELREDPLGLGELTTGPLGLYQQGNLALALGALCELVGGWELRPEAIKHGLSKVALRGRFEVISRAPYVVLDAARNPTGAAGLLRTLKSMPDPGGRRWLLFAIDRGQPVRATAETLFPAFDEVILCSGDGEETLPAQAVLPQARRLGMRCRMGGTLPSVVGELVPSIAAEDLLVVVGPKELLGEVHRELGPST